MDFVVNMFNHNPAGQRSLEDVIGIFGHGLRALGHGAVWDVSNDKFLRIDSGINIIVEGFTPHSIGVIEQAYNNNCRFVCLATEEPIEGKGFNHGKEPEMVMRMKTFPHAMKFFEGILYLVPGDHCQRWFSQFKPSAYVDLGYSPTLVRVGREPPVFQYGFYGSITKRRHKILKELFRRLGKPHNCIRILSDFPTQEERDRIMRQCRVILQLRKYDAMGLVSSSRCNTALNLGRPVLAEPHDLSKPWDEVIKFSDSLEAFYNDAIFMKVNWQSVWKTQFERFQKAFTPQRCVGDPLEQIGLFDRMAQISAELKVRPAA